MDCNLDIKKMEILQPTHGKLYQCAWDIVHGLFPDIKNDYYKFEIHSRIIRSLEKQFQNNNYQSTNDNVEEIRYKVTFNNNSPHKTKIHIEFRFYDVELKSFLSCSVFVDVEL